MRKRPTFALALVLCVAAIEPASAKTVDREFHESFNVSPGARLDLNHGDGDVDIEPWDRDVIDVYVRYHAELKGGGIRSEPDFEVDFEQSGDTVRVRGREIGNRGIGFFFSREHEYTYTIKAPAYVVLDTKGDDGNIDVDGWRADIAIALDDGDLWLRDVEAVAVRIEAQDGDVEIDGLKASLDIRLDDGDVDIVDCESNRLKIRAQDGNVILDRCRGDFEIAVDDGDVDITRASVSKLDVRANDGDVDLELASATDLDLYVDAEDGDVSVELGSGISAAFSVETDDGSIRVSSTDWILTKKDHRVTGEIGNGEGRIRITTSDGNVTLR
ncbi:MAG: DUF4097 family beta strand repeat-containing protein [Thermoanaerobaculia bacterium]